MDSYNQMFGTTPNTSLFSPLEANDHPELDDLGLLNAKGTQQYQSPIGMLQWIISNGYFDIQTAVMTLPSFHACPQRGHLEGAKQIVGYIKKFEHATICFCTDLPDLSALPKQHFDWSTMVYRDCNKFVPSDMPLGKPVITSTHVDVNLIHNLLSGKSVTVILPGLKNAKN